MSKRCDICKKRLKFFWFDCKCNKIFCAEHRYPYLHDCVFDYKKFNRDRLFKSNPKIEQPKCLNI